MLDETTQEIARRSPQHPYVFVVGCPRSGTTLLQRMLDCHPQLAVANDTHFIPRAIEKVIPQAIESVTDGADLPLTPEIVESVRNYHRFARLKLPDATVRQVAAKVATYGQLVSALYVEYGRLRGKPLAGEKTPDYVRWLPFLHGLFPWTKVVHIIRDGRDVCLSMLEWAKEDKGPGRFELWREEPVGVCALWWGWHVSSGRRDGEALGPSKYRELQYEELVVRPEETLRDLANFLDLPFASEMFAYYEGKTRSQPGLSAKKAWLPPTPGLRDWRSQMAPCDVELFEAISGDSLVALGYERSFGTISPEIAAVAERCRRWWESEIEQRHEEFAGRVASAMDSLPENK